MEEEIFIRPYKIGDETGISELIAYTLRISNQKDYSSEYIEKTIEEHSPEFFLKREKEAHFYVVCDRRKIIGCGGITGYWGSITESYLLSIFVLPEYQGRGLGKKIIEILESDYYFKRAWRTEVGSSSTAVGFYQKMGYIFKNGVATPDELGFIRMEKRR
jgi:GNAT superfamily N-acetyltransferase